jgi:methyl-accepting chemotaxis protein
LRPFVTETVATASNQIAAGIGDSVEKVDAGSKLVGEAGSSMEEIVDKIRRVTDIMAQIMSASMEQSAGIEQVNQAIGQIDQVTQKNASLGPAQQKVVHFGGRSGMQC